MIVTFENQTEHIQLSSIDANVPLLAIEAANEIDELIQGRQPSLDSVVQLAEVLKQSFQLDQLGVRNGFVDSASVAVFSQAMDGVSEGHGASTVKELVQHATEIVKTLEASKNNSQAASLVKMRDFCIALASAATAYQQSIFEMTPSNPMRS